MSKKGVIRSKGTAQDGKAEHSSGRVEEISDTTNRPTGVIYSFDDQTLGAVEASTTATTADVTFDTSTDARGNTIAINVTPIR